MKFTYAIKRIFIQTAAVLAQNPLLSNFMSGTIYKGNLKNICTPGLNCYSCPAALGSCPLGALQSVAASPKYDVSFYALGFLIIVGALIGRLVCGFLCLFGWLQDLLYKIPTPKLKVPAAIDKPLRWLKYVVLVALVLVLPAVLTNSFGKGEPFFCAYICPAGTIEAGLPLLAANESLRAMLGILFDWKLALAVGIVIAAVFIERPFCKYLCPLGAIYALFNKVSFLRMQVDFSTCISCGACTKTCPMQTAVPHNINSTECIRCGQCKNACPVGAISWNAATGKVKLNTDTQSTDIS